MAKGVAVKEFIDDATMTTAGNMLAEALRQTAPHEHIRKSVRLGRSQKSAYTKFINVEITAPDARAFDKGSGIHATRYGRHTYKIAPRSANFLVFFWKRKNRWFKGRPGQAINHPGVEGTGYVKEAKDLVKEDIKALFAQSALRSLRTSLKVAFTGLNNG